MFEKAFYIVPRENGVPAGIRCSGRKDSGCPRLNVRDGRAVRLLKSDRATLVFEAIGDDKVRVG
jgi:hypothetical protein